MHLSLYLQPELPSIDDIDKDMPEFEDTLSNDIPSFPFPSVFDFVSEINRPMG